MRIQLMSGRISNGAIRLERFFHIIIDDFSPEMLIFAIVERDWGRDDDEQRATDFTQPIECLVIFLEVIYGS